MDKKTLMMTSVGLLSGLLVGVAIGYFVAPSLETTQTQGLKNQISNLQTQIDDLQNQNSNLQNQINQKDNQIQTLQEQVSELQALLEPIRKGAWNLVKNFEGSSYSINTDYFYVAGTDLRINWTWVRTDPEYGTFSIYLYREGAKAYTEIFWNLQESGTAFAHNIVPSNYYLKILGSNLDHWTITVEVWITR